ncbi:MAG: hypothetical protein LQ347_006682 [Umbilicaria vellea]|nr:MAG: hypothetical protein LQ347_006682 [Umbilicaria vellea]
MTRSTIKLPQELLDHIISYLDVEPPSLQTLRREPSITLTESDAQPLKNLSRTSRSLRRLTIVTLFKFARIRLNRLSIEGIVEQPSGSEEINDFGDFVRINALRSHIKGLVLYTEVDLGPELTSTGPRLSSDVSAGLASFELAHVWGNLLTTLHPNFITMAAPPSTLALLASCVSKDRDAWAFDMPLHILHFKMSYSAPSATSLGPPGEADLFHIRDWSHCTLNEGSSLRLYSTYEYFLKTTPSIVPLSSSNAIVSIRSVDYIAIFPLHDHTSDISRLLLIMPNLERLRVQLAPESSSKILEDQTRMQKGLPADMWMELVSGYSVMLQTIREMARLKHFQSLDYAIEGLRASLDGVFEHTMRGWHRCGGGCWTRDLLLDLTPESAMDGI